jgi:hypothetical protein
MTGNPISVTLPVGPAIENVKRLLFRPFDLSKWFVIGFCAWLAYLGQGGGFNFNVPGTSHKSAAGFRDSFERARGYVVDNLHWIVPVAIIVLMLLLILGVLMTWLRSRGEFMFLHCVAHNRAEIGRPWTEFAREGYSLFLFRLAMGAIGIVVTWPLLIWCVIRLYRMFVDSDWNVEGILGCIVIGMAALGVWIVFAVVTKLTADFVVPLMFLRRQRCLNCWREFASMIAASPGQFILYFLFQIVLVFVLVVLVLVVVVVTCCIAGCLLILPYLGTVVLLPVLVFNRSYSLFYLAQFGREFDVFATPPEPPPLPPEAGGIIISPIDGVARHD